MTNGRVVVNISGTKFELTCQKFAKLAELSNSCCLTEACITGQSPKEYFFERNAASFEALLEFLHRGDLHLPPTVCPKVFSQEMNFWGVDITKMGSCCYVKLVVFEENQKSLARFDKHTNQARLMYEPRPSPLWPRWERFRVSVWNILDVPSSSRAAKVYLVVLAAFILMSLFILVADTHPFFHRQMSRNEWKQYLGKRATNSLLNALEQFFGDYDGDYDDEEGTTLSPGDYGDDSNDTYAYNNDMASLLPKPLRHPNRKLKLKANPYPEASARIDALRYVEYATVVFFTLDFMVRNIFSPRKLRHFFSFGNIIDFLALASVYVVTIIELLRPKEQFRISTIDFIECVQFLRVLRLVRLFRDVSGVRVLFYSIRSSAPELCLLFSFLAAGVFLFATVIFFIDDRSIMKSIPDSAWWALITMTTVGYGEMIPVTFQGKIVGSLCAICGVIVIGLTVPIFVNNFVMFYSYSKTFEAREKTKKIPPENAPPDSQYHKNKVFPEKDMTFKGACSPVCQVYTDVTQ
ncbi:potassium voltage-gated channel subfamily C member 3-like [Gigantopelta aegis]|uniref:potassium voltage-gated channel subfamily C member 3-like n=1 Tax=Gigantopelta aegis TaxID=1735272 RepID=UPI001B88AD45|nr:potassium voltage-gated channel subfamily C member 3-like [Gigantopelta aegis]